MKLIHGDCIDEMKKINRQSIDMILTDPPYGITACNWDKTIDFNQMWKQIERITKPDSAIVLMCKQPFTTLLINSNLLMFKYSWTWIKNKKTNFLNVKKQPLRQTEDIAIFYNKQCIYNPQKTTGHKPVNSFTKNTSDGQTLGKTKIGFSGGGQTDRYPSDIININVVNNDSKDKLHPTQKPVKLMEYLIKTYTNNNGLVLDFAMGSGTTGVACKNINRRFIGIELNKKYFNIAKERINSCNT